MAWQERVRLLLLDFALPFGMLCMLTGMLWLGDHGRYPKVFLAFSIPALALFALAPLSFRELLRSPIVLAFIVFATYFSVSITWSGTEESFGDLIKRPLLVLVLFFGITEFARQRPKLLYKTISIAAVVALITAVYEIGRFFVTSNTGRLASEGALYNPLLISHVYGFFTALWLGWLYTRPSPYKTAHGILAVLILLTLLALTGSRTPLVAVTATAISLTVIAGHRKGMMMLAALAAIGFAGLMTMPEMITQRGFSYRPEIWSDATRQILEFPWFGHGFGTPLFIKITDISYPFRDPHNLTWQSCSTAGSSDSLPG
ncbi:MAG: O-antigen ligase family protein [Betaproteobacteria bacterium]|nr:O-antigen ligase family protein [Betaproteobacteria bacterium]